MHISNKQTNIQTTSKEMAPADGKQSLATAEKTPKKYFWKRRDSNPDLLDKGNVALRIRRWISRSKNGKLSSSQHCDSLVSVKIILGCIGYKIINTSLGRFVKILILIKSPSPPRERRKKSQFSNASINRFYHLKISISGRPKSVCISGFRSFLCLWVIFRQLVKTTGKVSFVFLTSPTWFYDWNVWFYVFLF